MSSRNIAVIGGAASDFVEFAVGNNINYTIFSDARRLTGAPNEVAVNFAQLDTILEAVKAAPEAFTAILTFYEEYIVDTAHLASKLGLPSMTPEAAVATTDKTVMRSAFAAVSTSISPAFAHIESLDDALTFCAAHGYPVMLKPASLAKSLLVTKVNNEAELCEQFQHINTIIAQIYEKYAPRNTPKLLIEEYMEGTIHSIDAFVDGDGEPHLLEHIVDYQTGYDIGFDDNFHYSRTIPSRLDESQQADLKQCATAGVKALGIRYCPAHIEVIMTKQGARLVEIGARNGGYRQRMHLACHGINLYENHMRLLHDEPLQLTPLRNDPCVVLELFPRKTGVYDGIANQTALESLPSLEYLHIRRELGEPVGTSRDGHKAAVVIMLHTADHEQFAQDLAFVNSEVSVKVLEKKEA